MYTYYGCYQFVIEIDSTLSVQIALILEYGLILNVLTL